MLNWRAQKDALKKKAAKERKRAARKTDPDHVEKVTTKTPASLFESLRLIVFSFSSPLSCSTPSLYVAPSFRLSHFPYLSSITSPPSVGSPSTLARNPILPDFQLRPLSINASLRDSSHDVGIRRPRSQSSVTRRAARGSLSSPESRKRTEESTHVLRRHEGKEGGGGGRRERGGRGPSGNKVSFFSPRQRRQQTYQEPIRTISRVRPKPRPFRRAAGRAPCPEYECPLWGYEAELSFVALYIVRLAFISLLID